MSRNLKYLMRMLVMSGVVYAAFWLVMREFPITDHWLGIMFLLVVALLVGDRLARWASEVF
jgi:hypothetical protein